jgi:hypothetical protein
MFLDLPLDLQENIFQRLDAKNRTRMALALPKTSKLYNAKRERRLAIASRYIEKNRGKLRAKEAFMKPVMVEFLKSNMMNDLYVKQYCEEFGINNKQDENDDDDIVEAVKRNRVCPDKEYKLKDMEWVDRYTVSNQVIWALYYNGTPETFTNLCKNKSTSDAFCTQLEHCLDKFLFNLVKFQNRALLHFITREDHEMKSRLEPLMPNAIESLAERCHVFNYVGQFELLTTYFTFSKETIQRMIDSTEENMLVDSWAFLMNYLTKA